MKKRTEIPYVLPALLVSAFFCLVGCQQTEGGGWTLLEDVVTTSQEAVATEGAASEEKTTAAEEETSEAVKTQIAVYVCGQVVSPGVYYLTEGSRIVDAVEVAGGMSAEAATEALNLADWLYDGEMIYIPSQEELASGEVTATVYASQAETAEESSSSQININTASKEELMTLTGIGEAKAEAIMEYREMHGGFADIEELMEVSGIGESTYARLKDAITVGAGG